jgi:ribosomal protein S14
MERLSLARVHASAGRPMSECFILISKVFLVKNRSEIHVRRCSGNQHGIVRKYGLNMTRRDFREKAETMGWKKVGNFLVCIVCDGSDYRLMFAVPINISPLCKDCRFQLENTFFLNLLLQFLFCCHCDLEMRDCSCLCVESLNRGPLFNHRTY